MMIGRGFHGVHTGVTEKPTQVGETMRRLLDYLKPYWQVLLVAGVMVVLGSLARIAGPYLTGLAVDRYITQHDLPGLNRIMAILLGIYIFSWFTNAAQTYITVFVGQRVLYTMRDDLFRHFQRLSVSFFDQHEAGDLMSRLTNDTQAINRTLNAGLVRLIGNFLFLIGVLIAMLVINWKLAVISMSVLPLMLFSTKFFSKRVRVASRASREKLGKVSTELEENISGVREVQAFGRERETIREFRSVNAENRDANVQMQTINSAFRPTLDIFSSIGIALVLGFGGVMALNDAVTVGIIVAFLNYVRRFFQPVRAISNQYTMVQTAIAAAERIFSILDESPQITDAPDAVDLTQVTGHVVFDHVSFRYTPDAPVLQDVSFEARPGQMIAIVGPTGAGKTTMVNLLMRFYDVNEGRILLDGYDIRQVKQENLRRQIGMVLQDNYLFSGSVMDNIRYGRLEASDEDVITAAQTAGADPFIRALPQGYQTPLRERGSNLSLGQRQLIAIARAILSDPRILILDEATSSVDTHTEREIQAALEKLLHGRTSIVIAHRLSTIRSADQVLVISEGRIVERGTHAELLATRGFYYRLYTSQFGAVEQN